MSSRISYAALGDSYTAGPGLLPQRSDPLACGRTGNNYPSYLAGWLRVAQYRDVSCTGAATADLIQSQVRPDGTRIAPQADALGPDVDLVTVTLGGNDGSYFVLRLLETCIELAPTDSDGAPCTDFFQSEPDLAPLNAAQEVESHVVDVIRHVRDVAPNAVVVVVGYPQMFPRGRTCPQLGLTAKDSLYGVRVMEALVRSLRSAAESEGVRFVDLVAMSNGHDFCSNAPYFEGRDASPGGPTAWHPFQEYMRETARVIYEQLTHKAAPKGARDAAPDPDAVVINQTAAAP